MKPKPPRSSKSLGRTGVAGLRLFRCLLPCFAAAMFFQQGLLAEEKAPDNPGNALCPVLTDEAVDPAVHVDVEGKTVYLCCNRCRREFLEAPEVYLPNLSTPQPEPASYVEEGEKQDTAVERHPEVDEIFFLHWLGRFHVLLVHFPIALVYIAGLAELFYFLFRKASLRQVVQFNLSMAALGSMVSVLLGWLLVWGKDAGVLVEWHRWIGLSACLLVTFTALLSFGRGRSIGTERENGFRFFLIVSMLLIAIAAHLGGSLVYGTGYLLGK